MPGWPLTVFLGGAAAFLGGATAHTIGRVPSSKAYVAFAAAVTRRLATSDNNEVPAWDSRSSRPAVTFTDLVERGIPSLLAP